MKHFNKRIHLDETLSILDCPVCGESCLHHQNIVVYHRHNEDAEFGSLVLINNLDEAGGEWLYDDGLYHSNEQFQVAIKTDQCMKESPSLFRGALTISFECESCGSKPCMSISQHKGASIIEWMHLGLTGATASDSVAPLEAPHPGAKDFGTWVISGDQLVLRTDETRAVDLESCNCSAPILDWIFHYRDRLTHQEMADLLQAFESILHPRQNYCGDGVDKGADPLLLLDQWLNPKPQRKPIKPSVRFQILKRDGYRCQMCGATAKDGATLEIDHITPVSKGGSNDPENLQVLCRDCNAGKSDHLL